MARSEVFKDKSRIDANEGGKIKSCDTARVNKSPPSRKAHLDTILDEALDETFPASDPISIDFESPQSPTRPSKHPHDK